ncbi:Actin-binding FH2 [Penicillium digitatum]|uniref:Actin-binding FH2 n=1 Tax=Penicillium digitatum TaxID=36651 RepID=A0A7T6XIY9_PENDI|nr:Actin-binding FH2 [Penicillium digitatum]
MPIGPCHSYCDSGCPRQNEAGQDGTRQAQFLTLKPSLEITATKNSTQSLDLRHQSLDGPGETPGAHLSPFTPRGRRSNRTRDDAHSQQSTRQRNSDNESSQFASPPSQAPRTPAIRSLRQTTPSWQLSNPISIPQPRPTDGICSSQPPAFPSFSGSSWEDFVSDETVANYRAIGAQYQAWIAGPTTTPCPIRQSKVTWTDLVHHPLEEFSFEVHLDDFRSTPEEVGNIASTGLSTENTWRYIFLRQYGYWDGGRQEGYTVYQHRTGLGAIFVENITRRFGPYWAQVAQAQYQLDNHIDTLRYVYFTNVQNLHTWPYVECHLYPRHDLHWFDDHEPQCWAYGTREYQELLGTKLGRGVARLVLGAWPRDEV